MAFFSWSKTAGSNATADATINWAEGQAPSSVNDSARAMMARLAEYRDDISCSIGAGGTASAFTVATSQVFTSLAAMDGKSVGFIAPATNAAGCTLNVDGLGALPINIDLTTPIPAGVMVANSAYRVVYFNSIGQFRLCSLMGNPFNIPLAGGMDYWGTTVPNSSFAFPIGQAISRTTYAALFALIGTTYGGGDGSTTFNLPDKTGRVSAMKEAGASRLTSTYFGGNSTVLGAVGGAESHTLTTAELAAHSHANSLTDPGHGHTIPAGTTEGVNVSSVQAESNNNLGPVSTSSNTTGITITNASAGSGNPHAIVQPTIVCNYIMRII